MCFKSKVKRLTDCLDIQTKWKKESWETQIFGWNN